MKALPKRKGNPAPAPHIFQNKRLNESPSEKEGKSIMAHCDMFHMYASMKALPKRKGNLLWIPDAVAYAVGLNESPSEKEGKWVS